MGKSIYTENLADLETGEVISKRWITKEYKNTEPFVRAYIEDIGLLAKCSGAEQSVILCSLKFLDYKTNKLFIDSTRRIEIAECGNLKLNTVNSAIQRLVKKNILIKEGSATYLLNPALFFFGSDLDRSKVFELTIQYKIIP